MSTRRPMRALGEGVRSSVQENSPAYAYSIMITASYGVTSTLSAKPSSWAVFLFALGAVAGFALVHLLATHALRVESAEASRTSVKLVVALLSLVSILGGIGTAALVAWAIEGWPAWLLAPFGASAAFMVVNGIEYAVAEEEEGARGDGPA